MKAGEVPRPPDRGGDAVELGAPGRVFWGEASQLGLLAGAAGVPGPLGAALSEAARGDLRDLAASLESRGVSFARERLIRMGESDRWERLEAGRVMEHVVSGFSAPLRVSINGGTLFAVRDLMALLAVDVLHGSGDASLLSEPRLAEVLRGAAARGESLQTRPPRSATPVEVPAFYAYQVLAQREPYAAAIIWDGDSLQDGQDAIAHDVLTRADASPAGLQDAATTMVLREALDQGITFLAGHHDIRIDVFEARRRLARSDFVTLGLGETPVVRAHAHDLAEGLERVRPFLDVKRRLESGHGLVEPQSAEVLKRLVPLGDTPEMRERAELAGRLFDAARDSGRHDPWQMKDACVGLYDWLTSQWGTLARPSEQVEDVVRWTAACGADGAREAASHAWTALATAHPEAEDHRAAVARFDGLIATVHNVDLARQAMRVLEVAVAGTDADGRLAVFEGLVDSGVAPEDALEDYLVLAAAARPGATLDGLADHMAALRAVLRSQGEEGETRATFEFLENGAAAGRFGDVPREDLLVRFGEALVQSGSAEAARLAMLRGEMRGDGRIEREDEVVVIGGIRVPVKP